MVAGAVLSLARGETPRQAVLFGISAGAAAVMTPGSELCRGEDAERLYANSAGEVRMIFRCKSQDVIPAIHQPGWRGPAGNAQLEVGSDP